jgi:hypothetical protein
LSEDCSCKEDGSDCLQQCFIKQRSHDYSSEASKTYKVSIIFVKEGLPTFSALCAETTPSGAE